MRPLCNCVPSVNNAVVQRFRAPLLGFEVQLSLHYVPRGHLHKAGWAGGSWPLCLTSRQSEVIGSRKSHLSSTIGWVCAQHKNNISSIYTLEHQLSVSLRFARRERQKEKDRDVFIFFSTHEDRFWVKRIIGVRSSWSSPLEMHV